MQTKEQDYYNKGCNRRRTETRSQTGVSEVAQNVKTLPKKA